MRLRLTMMPDGHVAVTLNGEIDIVTAPAARDVLAKAVSRAVTEVTVDLSEVTFMDAAGLGMLVGAARQARHLPGGLRLVALPARLLRLLRLTGLEHLAGVPAPVALTDPPENRRADGAGAEAAASGTVPAHDG